MGFIPNANDAQLNTKEIRFNGYGHEMQLGKLVWTHKLYGSLTSGRYIKGKYGQSPIILRVPIRVKLRHARKDWFCSDCGQKIYEGDMHGSEFYAHYCLDCVTPFRPEDQVDFNWSG